MSWSGHAAFLAAVAAFVGMSMAGGCYPNPDDLRRGATTGAAGGTSSGSAGKTGTAGSNSGGGGSSSGPGSAGGTGTGKAGTGGSSGPGAGGRGGTGGSTTGAAGSSSTGAAGGSVTAIPDATLTSWAAAVCAQNQRCIPSIFTYQWGDSATCNARYKLWIKTFFSAGYPDLGVTNASLMQCATAIGQETCTDFLDGKLLPACYAPGKRANGQGCAVADQCASQFCANNAAGCGVCAPMVAMGGACEEGECAPPLVCGELGTCVPARAANASCANDTLSCARSLRCRGGVCAAPLAVLGAACVGEEDCDAGHGLLCDTSAGKCVAWTSSATTCGLGTTWTFCSKAGFCEDDGTCTPAASDTGLCDADLGPQCLYPAACTAQGRCSIAAAPQCPAQVGALTLQSSGATRAADAVARSLDRVGLRPGLSLPQPRFTLGGGLRVP